MRNDITSQEFAERFWASADRSGGPDACWPWMKARMIKGYGAIRVSGKHYNAQKIAWMLTHGPVPVGLLVCHHCDNPPCINPAHLFVGTARDNVLDCVRKGRNGSRCNYPKGEAHVKAKLTEVQVRELRASWVSGSIGSTVMARRYGITPTTVIAIVRGQLWKDAGGPIAESGSPKTKRARCGWCAGPMPEASGRRWKFCSRDCFRAHRKERLRLYKDRVRTGTPRSAV